MLGKNRVEGVLKRHIQGYGSIDHRNKPEIYQKKREAKINFIKKFKATESYFCRAKSATGIYLQPDLNINKMWKFYNRQCEKDNEVTRGILKLSSKYDLISDLAVPEQTNVRLV